MAPQSVVIQERWCSDSWRTERVVVVVVVVEVVVVLVVVHTRQGE